MLAVGLDGGLPFYYEFPSPALPDLVNTNISIVGFSDEMIAATSGGCNPLIRFCFVPYVSSDFGSYYVVLVCCLLALFKVLCSIAQFFFFFDSVPWGLGLWGLRVGCSRTLCCCLEPACY